MPDDPTAGGQTPPASPQNQGQTPPTGGQTTNQPPTPSEGDENAPMSVAEARRLRDELKQRRETEAAAKAELKKIQDAQLTESQRDKQRLAELEAERATHQREMQEL